MIAGKSGKPEMFYYVIFTLIELLPVPPGWDRVQAPVISFGEYLQNLPFEPTDSTFYWDGGKGIYHSVAAVHRMDQLQENQQCADIVMKLYSDYKKSRGEVIQWHDVNGKLRRYDNVNYEHYLNDIYNYSNTYSLHKFDSHPVKFPDMQPGDILIIPGFPGHVVVIVDIIKKYDKTKIAVVEGFMQAVQPFLYKTDDLHILWDEGVDVSGYHFDEKNLRRIF
jgi:hypothetical protein